MNKRISHSLLTAAGLALGLGACSRGSAPQPQPAPAPEAKATAAAPAQAAPFDAAGYLASIDDALASDPSLAEMNANEAAYLRARTEVLEPWRKALVAKDVPAFAALLGKGAKVAGLGAAKATVRRELDGIRESTLATAPAADAAADLSGYLAAYATVADARFAVRKVTRTGAGVRLEASFDLRGELASGGRRNDRGQLLVDLAPNEAGKLSIVSVSATSLERIELVGRGPTFADATAATGLDKVPNVDRREAIRRGGYAIASSDYDDDGRPDLLLGNWGPAKLYRNTGAGYEDVTEKAGLQPTDLVKSAAFVDLDNDHKRDLVLLRFVPSGPDAVGDFVAYRNKGDGTFEFKGSVLPKSRNYDHAMPLTVADLDNNGTLDIYLGFPGGRDFTNGLKKDERPAALSSQGVWFNEGGWKFREAAPDNALVRANHAYPHAVVASDMDLDGKIDILVVDDSGRVNPIYKNQGGGRFEDVTAASGTHQPGWSMGLSTGDFDNDGKLDIVSTNVAFTAGVRVVSSVDRTKLSPGAAATADLIAENNVGALLYHNEGDGTYREMAAPAGLSDVGDGAAGAEFIDYNADGLLDVVVPNGLWSSGGEEFDSRFIRAMVANSPKYSGESDIIRGSAFRANNVTKNPMLALLRENRALSLGGHQRFKLFRNNGDKTFTEVGYLENTDLAEDGYVVSLADHDNDGRPDLLFRHCDPAPGAPGRGVTLMRNTREGAQTLTVFARGVTANHDGIGAVVTAVVGGKTFVREIRATNGAVQSEAAAVFGLGQAAAAEKVTVRWPNGKVQVFKDVQSGRVVLRENAEMQRLPSGRRVR